MKVWQVARWVLFVVWALAVALFLVRGPEDTWIRSADGGWVAHGRPAGPPPAADYEPPLAERILPAVVLAVLGGAAVTTVFFAGRSPADRDALRRSIRYFGAVSIFASAFAVVLALVLIMGLSAELGAAFSDPGVVVLCLLGIAIMLKLLSWHADATKKLLEAHYDLKRMGQLLQETLERLATGPSAGSAPGVDSPSPPAV
ncbi:MAG TPA: hypothetical protein VMY87_02940 [Armatimonadota bacterium]|nr:hypothetical protein [Armatimonadota bacterium]